MIKAQQKAENDKSCPDSAVQGFKWSKDPWQSNNLPIILLTGQQGNEDVHTLHEQRGKYYTMLSTSRSKNFLESWDWFRRQESIDLCFQSREQLTSASISACLFSSSLATTMALCLPERLQHTAHSQSKVTTASSSGDICRETMCKSALYCVLDERFPLLGMVKRNNSLPRDYLCSGLTQIFGYIANPASCWSQTFQSCGCLKPPRCEGPSR